MFTFATKLNAGAAYAVTVLTQPTGQTCTVASGSGTANANVTNVAVTCASSSTGVTIGGAVTGLTGTGLVLLDNGGDNLSVTQNGPFTFATSVAAGAAYAVTVGTQPSGQTCTVTNGSATAGSANITNVAVACAAGAAAVGKFAYTANHGDGTITGYTIDPNSGALTSVSVTPYPDGGTPAAVSLAPNGKFAFSASDNGTKIHAFTIDQTAGTLTEVSGSPYTVAGFSTGNAYPDIAVDSQSAHLYLASAGDAKVAAFAINATTGQLTALPTVAAGAGASAIPAFSPDGKFLYVMDNTANAVSGYSIGADGSLTPMAAAFPTGAGPTWIAFTPDGKFAYVADTGADTISAYSVNATTGALTALTTPTFAADEHPQDLTIDASGTHLYAPVANGATAGAVQAYTINADGTLTSLGSSPAGVTPLFLAIDPAGPYAYASSKDGAEVYGYSINATTGALTALANSPFSTGAGSKPQFITIDPSGKFAYTANEGTANISEFAIDPTTGKLNLIGTGTVPAGLEPIFVSISPEAPGVRD
jgi:6-phosphogluconolactonase (cycloisomerase 2 family)